MGQVLTSNVDAMAPSLNVACPASATSQVVKNSRGRLFGVTVTATGANPLNITDGAGGAVIFAFAASPAVGYYPVPSGNVFYNSCLVVGSASNPVFVAHVA